jgi:hypothetical protein
MGEIRRPALLRNVSLPELNRVVKHDLDNLDRVHRRIQVLDLPDTAHGVEQIIDVQWTSLPQVIPGGVTANGNRIANVEMELENPDIAERSRLLVTTYFDAATDIVSSTVLAGSAVALTTATPANVTSISLTPGEWEVSGPVIFTGNNAATLTDASFGTTSATLATLGSGRVQFPAGHTAAAAFSAVIPPTTVLVAATATYYLVAQASFAGTATAYGTLRARRTGCTGLTDDVSLVLICD